jgi:MtaA/CmuA family methyltransferase
MNSKERCLAALRGDPVDRTPVFPLLMFLAADRAGIGYRTYATSGHALAEAQLNVLERYPLDAITACSDAFRLAADLGGNMVFPEDQTPYLASPLVALEADLTALRRPDPTRAGSRMADRLQAVREMTAAAGECFLVLGWVDMPFAEACSLVGVSSFMLMLVERPDLAHRLLEFLTGVVIDFGIAQVDAGGPMLGAGDAAASLISARMYREFALPYEQRVIQAVHQAGGLVKLHICGNTTHLLKDMPACGADLFNVDHLVKLEDARQAYGAAGICFKGNLDPVADLLQATPEQCLARSQECIRKARGSRYMLSAGCEIPAAVSDEVFRAFCEAVQV